MKRVRVHIDSLVLRGFRREDRHAIAGALEEELGRMIADPGVAETIVERGNIAHLKLPSINTEAGSTPEQIGGGVARALVAPALIAPNTGGPKKT